MRSSPGFDTMTIVLARLMPGNALAVVQSELPGELGVRDGRDPSRKGPTAMAGVSRPPLAAPSVPGSSSPSETTLPASPDEQATARSKRGRSLRIGIRWGCNCITEKCHGIVRRDPHTPTALGGKGRL